MQHNHAMNNTNQFSWWRDQMETFSVLLATCAGNSAVPGEFPAQRPVTRSFDIFFDLHLIKRLSKQLRGWWFETLLRPLWCHSNVCVHMVCHLYVGSDSGFCCPNESQNQYPMKYIISCLTAQCHLWVEGSELLSYCLVILPFCRFLQTWATY